MSDHHEVAETFLEVAMYFCQDDAEQYFNVAALKGINNTHFPDKAVPFAPSSKDEQIALKKYGRAHWAGYVTGPPVLLMKVKIPAKFAFTHFVLEDIKVLKRPEKTFGFMLPVNKANYPHMQYDVTLLGEGVRDDLLKSAKGFWPKWSEA